MPIDYIRVEGVEKVIKNLERFSDELRRQAPDVLRASLSNLKDHFEYPPSSDANMPKFGSYGPYYNRGVGSAYKRKRDGGVTQYYNSERLGANWTEDIYYNGPEIKGVLGNKASYGPYVHGPAQQSPYHAKRGWKTTKNAIDAERKNIVQLFERMVQNVTKRFKA